MGSKVMFDLVMDSCCELPLEVVEQPGIKILRCGVTGMGESHEDDMFKSTSAHEFYEAMRNGAAPTTAQPSLAKTNEVLRESLEAGRTVVYLVFSHGISSCYEDALVVADDLRREYGADAPLYLVDLLCASTTEAVVTMEAVRLWKRGISPEEMVSWAEEARYFVHTMFMVDDLKTLQRGGRLRKSVAVAGTMLDVKPLLTWDLDGCLILAGMARGRKKGIRRLAEYYRDKHGNDSFPPTVFIGNADCPEDVERLKALILAQGESVPFQVSDIGPTIGSHVGPGMLSCCFWGPDRRLQAKAK